MSAEGKAESESDATVHLSPDVASGRRSPEEPEPAPQPLRPSALEERFISEAIKRGMITAHQARTVLDEPAGPKRVTDRLVKRGLIPESQARALEAEVQNTIVPGYVILGELGRGGMGVVYRARQTSLDRSVALKVVSPEASADLEFLRRFELEAKALGRLNHPHIVQVYDCGKSDERLFIALEFVDGRDCLKELEAEGPFPRQKALDVLRQAALGLKAAHQAGIIHRDVKPGNVLLVRGEDGKLTAKIADLGLALLSSAPAEGRLTQAGTVMGSPAYMAPEQSRAEAADHRSDIYALGATLYHLLGGQTPFAHGGGGVLTILSRKLTEQLDPPPLPGGTLDEGLLCLLDRMLARRPQDRPQTWDEVVSDLEALLAGRPPRATRVAREHSSLRLGPPGARTERAAAQGAETTMLTGVETAPAGGGGGPLPVSRAPLLIGAAALLGLVAAAALLRGGDGKAGPGTGSGGGSAVASGSPAGPLGELSAAEVARGIEALEGLTPERRLNDEAVVLALQEKLATLSPGDQVAWRLRLRAALDEAVEATQPERVARLEQAWRAGEWEALGRAAEKALQDYARWEREAPARMHELRAFAAAAAKDGAGAAERAAWQEIQAAQDPRERLRLLQGFAGRFPWSPALDEAARLQAEADAAAPQVELVTDPAGAELSVDGQGIGPAPWSGRLPRGAREVRAEAPGHVPMAVLLAVEGPTRKMLVLGPVPARALVEDTERGQPLFKANRWAMDWAIERGEWKAVSGGVWGDRPADGGWITVRRDLAPLLSRIGVERGGPWQVQWELTPPSREKHPGAVAEVRLLAAEDGRVVVVGWREDQVYLGLRGSDDALEVRAWARFSAERPPGRYQLDWDGAVVAARTKQGLLGTLRLPWAPASDVLQLALNGGEGTFTNLHLHALAEKK